ETLPTTERVQIGNSPPTVARATFLSRQPPARFGGRGGREPLTPISDGVWPHVSRASSNTARTLLQNALRPCLGLRVILHLTKQGSQRLHHPEDFRGHGPFSKSVRTGADLDVGIRVN